MSKLLVEQLVDEFLLKKISSICTDGTNVNIGERGGLWAYFEREISKIKSNVPLVKIWCVAHRANLSFRDLANRNATLSKLLETMSSIASYFNKSAVRTARLKEIAAEKGLKFLVMPKIFDIRWVGHKFQLIKAVINNWKALVLYFQEDSDAIAKGFHTFLIDAHNLRMVSFCADLLNLVKLLSKIQKATSVRFTSIARVL